MSLYMRVSILLVVILASPSLQWKRFGRQVANVESEDCKTPNDVPGQCIDIKSCPVMLKMAKERKEPGWRDYLINSRCGPTSGRVIKVCCPDTFVDTSQCGRSIAPTNRVVGGQPAVLGAWPWMAALGYSSSSSALEWLCGGSLITNKHVLTAAHCVTNIGSRQLFVVRLGDLNLDDNVPDRATPTNVSVEGTIVHENYNPRVYTVDIALVILKDRVEFTELIRPICVPTQNTFAGDLTRYEPFVTGWGAIEYRGPKSTALLEAQIDVVDEDFCKQAYQNFSSAIIDDRVVCALSSVGKDTCQGDSGGPLILPGKNANFYLLGIVSYGFKCAEAGYPGIYTKVSLYIDWITKNTRS